MKVRSIVFILSLLFLGSISAFALPSSMTFQTKILGPSGSPLEDASVNFRFTFLDTTGTCTLFVEDFSNIDMTNSKGITSISLGTGSKQFPPTATNLYEIFNNSPASGFACQGSGTPYNPSIIDNRQMVMQFNDGSGWQTLPQMSINSVPFSHYATRAENLGAYPSTAYLRPSTLTSCTAGQALHWDGTSFSCVTASGGGGGPAYTGVTPISNASGDITLAAPTSTGKIIISSNTPSTNTTTGAVVVTGGMGVSGTINSGSVSTTGTIHSATTITASGDITTGGTLSALTSIFTPQIYGTTAASGALRLDGTSNATAGNVLIATAAGGGNVGIGTASANNKLTVSGTLSAGNAVFGDNNTSYLGGENGVAVVSSSKSVVRIVGAIGVTNGNFGEVSFLNDETSLTKTAAISALAGPAPNPDQSAHLAFSTHNGTAFAERMRLDRMGNLGIGTTNPTLGDSFGSGYTVLGVGGRSDAASSPGVLELANTRTTPANNDSLGQIRFSSLNNGAISGSAAGIFGELDGTGGANGFGGRLKFMTKNDNFSLTEKMRINSEGNVGIGVTSPQAALDVVSTGTSSAVIVPRATTGNRPTTLVNGMIRYNTTTALFEFYQNGGWVNYTTVSDGRLKTNVTPVNQGLDIINQLNPVFFDWDQNNPRAQGFGSKHQVGFIAQEVEKVLPEVVNKGEDSYRSVEYGKIVSVVVAAVKELYAKVMGHDEKIQAQDREIASVKAENAQIKIQADAEKAAKDKEIAELKAKAQKAEQENAAMKARLDKIEKMLKSK